MFSLYLSYMYLFTLYSQIQVIIFACLATTYLLKGILSHGNSKTRTPFYPTLPSTKTLVKSQVGGPKSLMGAVSNSLGGVMPALSPCDLPRNERHIVYLTQASISVEIASTSKVVHTQTLLLTKYFLSCKQLNLVIVMACLYVRRNPPLNLLLCLLEIGNWMSLSGCVLIPIRFLFSLSIQRLTSETLMSPQ